MALTTRPCGCSYDDRYPIPNGTGRIIFAMCETGRLLYGHQVEEHLGWPVPTPHTNCRVCRTPYVPALPPGRVATQDGRTFQQHWLAGMRGRIYRDLHHPERVGREVVAIGTRYQNNFGPCVEIDGTISGYWWGDVEVIDPSSVEEGSPT